MKSGGEEFLRYLTSRKAPLPRFVILEMGGESLPKKCVASTPLQHTTTAHMFGSYSFTFTTHKFEITATINYKYFVYTKGTICGNRLPRVTPVKKVWEPLV